MSTALMERSWTSRLLVFSLTAAIAVSVIYLPQSMLTDMATNLGVASGVASIVATTVQMGYALGILLLVPLSDRTHPRKQITVQSLILAAALIASAVVPEVVSVAVGFLVVGLVANIAQVLIPAATRMAPADRRAATTSTLVGVLLIGIFGGRIVSSLLVEAIGWRWVIIIFAAMVLAIIPFLRRALDAELPVDGAPTGYGRLLLATVGLLRRSPALLQASFVQFFVFAIFNATWTVMVLYLTEAPFNWSILAAGLFGVVGLAAGIVTPLTGRFVERVGSLAVSGIFIAVLLVSTLAMIVDSSNLAMFAITMFLATWANQSILSANQMRVLAANPGRSAQANTLFMFFVFLGGAVGAFLGPIAFAAGGIPRVALLSAAFVIVAAVGWIVTGLWSRRARRGNAGRAVAEPSEA